MSFRRWMLLCTWRRSAPSTVYFCSISTAMRLTSSSVRSLARVLGLIPVALMISWAMVMPIPWMYCSAMIARFSFGMSTPAMRGMLALPLLVLRVHADHPDDAAAAHDLAHLADALDGDSDLHGLQFLERG